MFPVLRNLLLEAVAAERFLPPSRIDSSEEERPQAKVQSCLPAALAARWAATWRLWCTSSQRSIQGPLMVVSNSRSAAQVAQNAEPGTSAVNEAHTSASMQN